MALRKFKFVEQFIDPATGQPYPDTGSPKTCHTTHFGDFEGHQIAKIEWVKKIVKRKTSVVDKKTGKTVEGEEKEFVEYEERMGEKGGWIETSGNLAQGGKCWVKSGGFILGNAFVSGDAEIEGEVGESAKVYDKAKIKAGSGVGGSATVFGEAEISSAHKGGAVLGNAKVGGEATVDSDAVVKESARVMGKAKVSGQAEVGGLAQILGNSKVAGSSSVKENAIIYGEVMGKASIMGTAIILEGGIVKDNAIVSGGAIVGGTVEGNSIVNNGQPFIGKNGKVKGSAHVTANANIDSSVDNATITGNARIISAGNVSSDTKMTDNATVAPYSSLHSKSSMAGNGWLQGRIQSGEIGDNAMVGLDGSVSKGKVNGNGKVCSQSSQSEVSGGVSYGNLSKAKVTGGVLVEKSGRIDNGSAEDSAVIVGRISQGTAKDGPVIAAGGSLNNGVATDNSKILSSFRGSARGNGIVAAATQAPVSGNAILLGSDMTASQNQVFVEKKNSEPGEAAVICKVEKE